MKPCLIPAMLLAAGMCTAQPLPAGSLRPALHTGPAMPQQRLKTSTQLLPRWVVDLCYQSGPLQQQIRLHDMLQAYDSSIPDSSCFAQPRYAGSSHWSLDLQLGFFPERSRHWGLSTGLLLARYGGRLRADTFAMEYRSTDTYQDALQGPAVFRQLIRNAGAIEEALQSTAIHIPLMLQFRHQFRGSGLGISAAAGGFAGLYQQSTSRVQARFDYEALYRIRTDGSQIIRESYYDAGPAYDGYNWQLTREASLKQEGGPAAFLDRMRQQYGANTGLDQAPLQAERSIRQPGVSLGFTARAALTYYITYQTSIFIGGYYRYEHYRRSGNEAYRMTGEVGSYNSMLEGIQENRLQAYGLSVGMRYFFGEKRDLDGDGTPDARDNCPREPGLQIHGGCPDSDQDGIRDALDECPFEYGQALAGGCPDADQDGVADRVDECPQQAGDFKGCPFENLAGRLDSSLDTGSGQALPPHVVLETDLLYFDHNSAAIRSGAQELLERALPILQRFPQLIIHFSSLAAETGHNNAWLAADRALAAQAFLVSRGIAPQRIFISGAGQAAGENNPEEEQLPRPCIRLKLLMPLQQ